jgi:nitrile hydratase
MQGFGPVAHSLAEPAFQHRWEAAARALLAVVAGTVEASGGEFRHSIERMDPGHYLTSGYYEHWLTAAATLAVEHGLVTRAELEARAGGRFPLSGPVLAPPVGDAGPDVGEPRFGVGDRVRVRDWHPPGHTRCPGYVRGKAGTVVRVDGTHSVPDIEAHGYPWPTLGLPPAWYKDPPYRARMIREPRTLLAEMGCQLPGDVEIRVWDSSAEVRYLVLPQRPPGTEGMTEAELAGLVTRDSMIGVARL